MHECLVRLAYHPDEFGQALEHPSRRCVCSRMVPGGHVIIEGRGEELETDGLQGRQVSERVSDELRDLWGSTCSKPGSAELHVNDRVGLTYTTRILIHPLVSWPTKFPFCKPRADPSYTRFS